MKEDLLNSLPREICEQLQWRVSKVESHAAFRNFVKATPYTIQRGKIKANVTLMAEQEGFVTMSSGKQLPL